MEKNKCRRKDCLFSVAAHLLPGMKGDVNALPFPTEKGSS